ncbi:hypothetical protein KW850_10550 [Bacillus sp. sid0103]|uniref:hypothetical protein n=1 Tax=Bacillus sp. sid0103 TaxID=2856337 RepID=UPI001C43A733|nr:hypothetical protein [Bacillus sp. sid0103]MBV7505692.1 hypothetical protein [Bacillus sp. sid0103]
MFKSTLYKKVNWSRNVSLLILAILLVGVSGKIIMAHEKLRTYKEAVKLYQSGELVAAEEKFRAAKLNVFVTDHNKDINQKLSILSPIRKAMEEFDNKAANYKEENDLDKLVSIYDRWQESQKKWVSGTSVQKDMYGEMVALTNMDRDMKGYFSTIKKVNLDKLVHDSINGISEEEEIYTILNKIPIEYYGKRSSAKTKEVQTAFENYYSTKLNKIIGNGSVSSIVDEGNRQFSALKVLSMDSDWLEETLDANLLRIVTKAMNKKDYAAYADAASTIKKLEGNMNDTKVFVYIEKSTGEALTKAENLTAANQYKDAISIYVALKPLRDTAKLISKANLAWDKYQPIRVLERLYTGKEFSTVVKASNKFGADSVVAAISTDGGIYYGQLTGEEAMVVTEGSIEGAPAIHKLVFQSSLSSSDHPVIYIDAKSSERKHRYLAYEVSGGSMVNILDVEADGLTIESNQVLVVDNPVGQGEGELAYFEPDLNRKYQFTQTKETYEDINVEEIANYYGKKVRFTAYTDSQLDDGMLVTLSETFNESTEEWKKTYLLLKGYSEFTTYTSYTVSGVFDSYTDITDENGESLHVPVFQVGKVE